MVKRTIAHLLCLQPFPVPHTSVPIVGHLRRQLDRISRLANVWLWCGPLQCHLLDSFAVRAWLARQFETQLAVLERHDFIETRHHRPIAAGEAINHAITRIREVSPKGGPKLFGESSHRAVVAWPNRITATQTKIGQFRTSQSTANHPCSSFRCACAVARGSRRGCLDPIRHSASARHRTRADSRK